MKTIKDWKSDVAHDDIKDISTGRIKLFLWYDDESRPDIATLIKSNCIVLTCLQWRYNDNSLLCSAEEIVENRMLYGGKEIVLSNFHLASEDVVTRVVLF